MGALWRYCGYLQCPAHVEVLKMIYEFPVVVVCGESAG